MLPQVENLEFIRLANEFLTSNPTKNVDNFIEYLFQSKPEMINKKMKYRKDAQKGFCFVLRMKADNINESLWCVSSTFVYNNHIKSPTDISNSIKRPFKDSLTETEVMEPKMKKQKLETRSIDKDFLVFQPKLEMSLLIPFPELLITKFEENLHNKSNQIFRMLISGPKKCGKTTFIRYISQKYNYQYVIVWEPMLINNFELFIIKLTQEYDNIILHFNFNLFSQKAMDNFIYEPLFEYQSKIIAIYECNEARSLLEWSDSHLQFDIIGKIDRMRYFEHFLKDYSKDQTLSYEKMATATPGYQIGEIKSLCESITKKINLNNTIITENLFHQFAIRKLSIKSENIKWSDIGGHDKVKEELMSAINDLSDENRPFKSDGIILYGPPGCGKTMLAKALSNELDYSFISMTCTDVFSKFQGESEKNVVDIFNKARSCQPCILFIDEIDALCSSRDDENSGSKNSVVNTFLVQMDGVASRKETKLLVIGATNFIDRIDLAISRSGRLGKHIEVNIPISPEQRLAVLMAASKNGTCPIFGSTPEDLIQYSAIDIFTTISQDENTKDWNHSDLASLIDSSYNNMKKNKSSYNIVTMKHIKEALQSKSIAKRINKKSISKEFDNNTNIILLEEMDDSIVREFTFDEEYMNRIDRTMSVGPNFCIIGGRRYCGKTTFINLLAKKYQYHLVSLKQNYFKNYNETKFLLEAVQFAKRNGSTLFHIDMKLLPNNFQYIHTLDNFLKNNHSVNIRLIFETDNIDFCPVIMPSFNNDQRLKMLSNNLMPLQLEADIDYTNFLNATIDWTCVQYKILYHSLTADNIISQKQLERVVNFVNFMS